jgi:hypothetical protein
VNPRPPVRSRPQFKASGASLHATCMWGARRRKEDMKVAELVVAMGMQTDKLL